MSPETFALASNIIHWGVGGLLALSLISFLFLFWVPGWRVGREVRRARDRLAALKAGAPVIELDRVRKEAMVSDTLRHCWDEFSDTLHGQRTLDAAGTLAVSRWRATAMAGNFFTEAALVDTRLRSEFFKHLPGILTGLGIIGTFSGLILGLQGFQVSDDANTVRDSLQGLLQAVGGAFYVSASAIGLAILVTFIEKVIVSRRYRDVEQLCSQIDGLFDSGAGEEYLARLVEASETSATQAAHIKDALVSDLKTILTELTDRQIATVTASNAQLAHSISATLAENLKGPLDEISGAVRNVSGQNGEAVSKLLTDVLAGFSARMEGMFGGQLGGINELLKQTAETMQGTAQRFEQLAGQIEQAGSSAADKMAERMESLMESMASREAAGNAQTSAFVEQLRGMLEQGLSQSAELMNSTFAELGQTTSDMVKQLETQAARSSAEMADRTQQFTARTEEALDQQGQQMGALTEAVDRATQTMQAAVESLRTGVDESVARMAAGAERLHGASTKLEGSLTAMTDAADGVGGGIDDLTQAAKLLAGGGAAIQQALNDQREVREATTLMVSELRRMVETAARDATVSSQLVTTLDGAAGKLVQAQREADTYLQGVTETLVAAHESFGKSVESTLRQGNAAFHKELAAAVDVLRGAIQELGDTLDAVPSRA